MTCLRALSNAEANSVSNSSRIGYGPERVGMLDIVLRSSQGREGSIFNSDYYVKTASIAGKMRREECNIKTELDPSLSISRSRA
jgi:hypothetical protein